MMTDAAGARGLFTRLSLVFLLSGCETQQSIKYEGVTAGAGNALAANTVMQMVDPWPRGVEDTDLVTPADHDQYKKLHAKAGTDGAESYDASSSSTTQ